MLFDLVFYSALALASPQMALVINQADPLSPVRVEAVAKPQPRPQPRPIAKLARDPKAKK